MQHVNRFPKLRHIHRTIGATRIVRTHPAKPFLRSRATSSRFHASDQFALDTRRNRASAEPRAGSSTADQASRQARPTCAAAPASPPPNLLYARIGIKWWSRTVAASEMAQCDLCNRLRMLFWPSSRDQLHGPALESGREMFVAFDLGTYTWGALPSNSTLLRRRGTARLTTGRLSRMPHFLPSRLISKFLPLNKPTYSKTRFAPCQ